MTVRSFKRAHARRAEREARRAGRLARRGRLLAGATLGAGALMTANAQAATTLTVTTTGDSAGSCSAGSCTTLRAALADANTDTGGTAYTIDLTGLSGTITLTGGALPMTNPHGITITGPGSGTLTVSGNHASQVFTITNTASASSGASDAINGLTITQGQTTSSGGAIEETVSGSATPIPLSLSGDVISDSKATGSGGAIATPAPLTITASAITGNTASGGGGGIAAGSAYTGTKYGNLVTLDGSQVTQNTTQGAGGGIEMYGGALTVRDSTVSGNTAATVGGGIAAVSKYGTTIERSTVASNTATGASSGGGGIDLVALTGARKYSPTEIQDSTITGNQATDGAGVEIYADTSGSPTTIDGSTISGNSGGAGSFGGGLLIHRGVGAPVRLEDSTVTGNSAATGGGVSLGDGAHDQLIYTNPNTGKPGSISFDNSTVSGNTATAHGGGIYLGEYKPTGSSAYTSGTAAIRSTIVSGNTAGGSADDLERASGSTGGGFTSAFSLIQDPGSAPLTGSQTITGVNPKLGPLAANGGPTETMMPAGDSPVIDQGHAYDDLLTDQIGNPRTVDVPWIAKPPGGDGTDIGAVEVPLSGVPTPPPPPNPGFAATIRTTPLGAGQPLLVEGQTPVDCTVRLGTLASCVIEVKWGGVTVADGGVSGSGAGLTTTVESSAAFQRYLLIHYPLGLAASAGAVGTTSSGPQTVTGAVRLLGGPSITLPLGRPSARLGGKLKGQLGQAAKLLAGATTVACTVYVTDRPAPKHTIRQTVKGHRTVSVAAIARSEAKAACATLRRDGLTARTKSSGRALKPNPGGNRLVITFGF